MLSGLRSVAEDRHRHVRPDMAAKHDRSKPHRHELPLHSSAALAFFPTKRKEVQGRSSDLFVSAKSPGAIPARHPALLHAPIFTSLNTTLTSLTSLTTASIAPPHHHH